MSTCRADRPPAAAACVRRRATRHVPPPRPSECRSPQRGRRTRPPRRSPSTGRRAGPVFGG
eukprot:343685-Chlamydomonas_euryale.AAC.1